MDRTGVDGQSLSVDVMEFIRPDDLVDIAKPEWLQRCSAASASDPALHSCRDVSARKNGFVNR